MQVAAQLSGQVVGVANAEVCVYARSSTAQNWSKKCAVASLLLSRGVLPSWQSPWLRQTSLPKHCN
jgi:hypothetical protein